MPQLQAFSGIDFGDFHAPTAIPCPVPDWENGVLRAYSQEEQRAIRQWYVDQGLAKPLEEIVGNTKIRTKKDLDEIREIGNELFASEAELNEFFAEIEEDKKRSFQVQLEKMKRDEELL
jgi:hypothetical protein